MKQAKEKAAAAPTARPQNSILQIRSMVETIMFPRSFASREAISTVEKVRYGVYGTCA